MVHSHNFFYFQGVLCQVNQSTKAVLNLLGVFTVSSFHAYICARSPSLLSNLLAGRGASRKRSLPTNQNLEQNSSVDRQNSLGMSVSKSFEDDEDDFNESSLINTRIPGKKVSNPNIGGMAWRVGIGKYPPNPERLGQYL